MNIMLAGQKVELPEGSLIGRPPKCPEAVSFKEAAIKAMEEPIDLKPLNELKLNGKKVCIIVDDWGRPTPAGEFLPDVINRLNSAGAVDESITVVTASGMHDPMSEEELRRKVGDEAFKRVRCISHDGGNIEMLSFAGITDMGTPVWVNKYAAEADFKIALGRIYPHVAYGYEGGYKMIVPGIAAFETILRDHSLNFSSNSSYGILEGNPSRGEADSIGRMVCLDYCVNFVINWDNQPVAAFGGTPEAVFSTGVQFGQHNVWCYSTNGIKTDVTIMCSNKSGDFSLSNNPTYYIGLGMGVTRPDGVIISTMDYVPGKRSLVAGFDLDNISFGELVRLHEKRNWNMENRQLQHVIKSIRGAFYERRIFEKRSQKLFLVSETAFPRTTLEKWNARQFSTIQEAYETTVSELGKRSPVVLALPDARRTMPIIEYVQ